jgi:hypothetical protein
MTGTGTLVTEDRDHDAPKMRRNRGSLATDDFRDAPEPTPLVQAPVDFPDVPVLRRTSDPRIPTVEESDGVKAARHKLASIREQYVAATAERQALEAELGLKAGEHKPGAVEKMAVELLAEGKDPSQIDRLESLHRSEKRLLAAGNHLVASVTTALDAARRQYQAAVDELMLPSRRAVALAWLELVKLHRKHAEMIHGVQVAGFSACRFGQIFPDQYPIDYLGGALVPLVGDGTVSKDEAAPFMDGR